MHGLRFYAEPHYTECLQRGLEILQVHAHLCVCMLQEKSHACTSGDEDDAAQLYTSVW